MRQRKLPLQSVVDDRTFPQAATPAGLPSLAILPYPARSAARLFAPMAEAPPGVLSAPFTDQGLPERGKRHGTFI